MWLVQWMKSRSKINEFDVPIPNFGRVVETIYRGALPDRKGYQGLHMKLGIRRVCSLIEHQSLEDRQRALDAGIHEWRHIPFSDRDAPTASQVRNWLEYIRTSEHEGSIFTHCRGGRHRTGMLVGVYRVTDCGWTKERAFQEMLRYGWYGALGHQPLIYWFFDEFEAKDFRREATVVGAI